MTSRRKIHLRNHYHRLQFKPADVRGVFHALDASGVFSAPAGELSVVFLDDAGIGRVHGDFLDDPTPTDVITFPPDPEMDFGGEILVSVDHAMQFAVRKELDFARELTLYLVHGYLHLAGFDDLVPEKKRQMRRAEKKALNLLEKADALPKFGLFEQTR
jgi:probable rRNA maturation factor